MHFAVATTAVFDSRVWVVASTQKANRIKWECLATTSPALSTAADGAASNSSKFRSEARRAAETSGMP